MKKSLVLVLICFINVSFAQKVEDLFTSSDTLIRWMGIDFTNVKLVGDFSQIGGAGEKSAAQVKKIYFPAWNRIILDEREKYDVPGMLRKSNLIYDIDMIMELNANAPLEEMESYNAPSYAKEDVAKFVSRYNPAKKEGIGIVFVAESLNKANTEAYFHFVAINLSNNEVLLHDRLKGKPSGIGLRNYWAGAINDVIRQFEKNRYKAWKSAYEHKKTAQ